jgi:riboflavin kinase/FMN adenylyltransferase
VEIISGIPGAEDKVAYPVLAVGNFDGVHLGHQAILKQVVRRAREVAGTAIAMTFDPHPVKVLFPDRPLFLLTSLQQKIRYMEALGIDRLLCLPFTLAFSEQKPTEFIENILYQAIRAREVYIGRNFAFGHGREGTAADLKRIGQSLGIEVSIIEPVLVNGIMVSSSRIRRLLLEGQVADAASLLGRPYELEGPVIPGDQRGRLLGFPTANVKSPQQLIPKPGVYAVQVFKGSGRDLFGPLAAAAYIGSRPTFGQGDQIIEVHLLHHEGELYQQWLRVAFLERVRDEMVFAGPEELSRQIKKDVDRVHAIHEEIAKTGRFKTYRSD